MKKLSVWFPWLVLMVLFSLLMQWAWVGYIISDDFLYIEAAIRWMNDSGYRPTSHWQVRYPLLWPVGLVTQLFGANEFSVAIADILYFAFAVILLCWWLRKRVGGIPAFAVCFVFAFTPLTYELLSTVNVDIVAAFWLLASAILFAESKESGRKPALLLLFSGVSVGIAFLSRGTAVGLLAGYGLFFLFGRYMPWQRYVIMGAGFFSALIADLLIFTLQTGDPFHRYAVLFTAHHVPEASVGNLVTVPYLEPIAALFLNNEFGLLYFFAAGFLFLLYRSGTEVRSRYAPFLTVAALALVHFLVVGYGLGLRAMPRYYTFITLVAAVMAAGFFALLWQRHTRKVAAMTASVFVAVSLLCIDVSNRDPVFSARIYAEAVKQYPARTVHSDARTCRLGRYLLEREAGAELELPSVDDCAAPRSDGLILFSAGDTAANGGLQIRSIPADRTLIGRAWSALGLNGIYRLPSRLVQANDDLVLIDRSAPPAPSEG